MRKSFRHFWISVSLCLFSSVATADVVFDVNTFYFSDAFVGPEESTTQRLFWDVAVGLSLTRRGSWALSWSYASKTFTDETESNTEFSVTEMGPKLSYFFGRTGTWSLSVIYNIMATGQYSGASTSELRGTSYKGELSYTPPVSESFFAGIKLNYYSASFSEEITNTTTLTNVSYTRGIIYPSLALIYRFE